MIGGLPMGSFSTRQIMPLYHLLIVISIFLQIIQVFFYNS